MEIDATVFGSDKKVIYHTDTGRFVSRDFTQEEIREMLQEVIVGKENNAEEIITNHPR
jgi:type II secretory pathway component HofQ